MTTKVNVSGIVQEYETPTSLVAICLRETLRVLHVRGWQLFTNQVWYCIISVPLLHIRCWDACIDRI